MSAGRRAVTVGAVVLGATVLWAIHALPGHVDLYYSPEDTPDAAVDRWSYLVVLVLFAVLCAFAMAAVGRALALIADAFTRARVDVEDVAAWASAWTLLAASAEVWLVIWLGNSEPVRRSWLEVLVVCAWIVGTLAVVVWRIAVGEDTRRR